MPGPASADLTSFSPTLVLSDQSDDDGSITQTLCLESAGAGNIDIKMHFLPGPEIPGTRQHLGIALVDWRHHSLQDTLPFSTWHRELLAMDNAGVVELDFTQFGGMLKYIDCLHESYKKQRQQPTQTNT